MDQLALHRCLPERNARKLRIQVSRRFTARWRSQGETPDGRDDSKNPSGGLINKNSAAKSTLTGASAFVGVLASRREEKNLQSIDRTCEKFAKSFKSKLSSQWHELC